MSDIKTLIKKNITSKEIIFFVAVAFLSLLTFYYYAASGGTKKILVIYFIGLVVVTLCYVFAKKSDRKGTESFFIHDSAFPIVILIMGILSCFFFPAGSIPDEPHHFYDSYSYYKSAVFSDFETIRAEDEALFVQDGLISKDISEARWGYTESHLFDSSIEGKIEVASLPDAEDMIYPVNLISDLPQQKLPSALGIGIGVALGLNHVWVFYLGRLFNMLFSVALILLAVKITRVGRNAMMVVALFPMTLQLLGSYSYDGPTIGLAFLSTALLTRLFFAKNGITYKDAGFFLLASFLLAPCKVVYSLISLIALFIPKRKFKTNRFCYLFKSLLLGALIVSILLLRFDKIFSLGTVSTSVDTRGSETGVFWSLSSILSNPVHSFAFFWHTLEAYGAFWLLNIFGDSLGWFQASTSLPDFVPIIFLVIYILSIIASRNDNFIAATSFRVLGMTAVMISAFGIILSMWLGWTFLTEPVIQGVQGRYFLPLLPLLAIAIRPKSIKCSADTVYPLLSASLVLDVASLIYIAAVA